MNAPALPLRIAFQDDASFGVVVGALRPHAARRLLLHYSGRDIQPGYHVTEVKAGAFATLDCGGNPDAWQETILQVEDLPASAKTPTHMAVSTFLGILDKVADRIDVAPRSRLTFEVGPPGQPMQVFDVAALRVEAQQVVIELAARPAICKPRHRAAKQAAAAGCCAPASGCC